NNEDHPARAGFAQEIKENAEPVGQAVQATVEAGEGERTGEIAEGAQDAQGAFVMVLKLAGGDHPHGHGRPLGSITITCAGAAIGAVSEGAQEIVKHDVDGYNQGVVHRSSLRRWLVSAPPFS